MEYQIACKSSTHGLLFSSQHVNCNGVGFAVYLCYVHKSCGSLVVQLINNLYGVSNSCSIGYQMKHINNFLKGSWYYMSGEINLIFPAEEVTKWMEIFVHFWPMFVFTVFKKGKKTLLHWSSIVFCVLYSVHALLCVISTTCIQMGKKQRERFVHLLFICFFLLKVSFFEFFHVIASHGCFAEASFFPYLITNKVVN